MKPVWEIAREIIAAHNPHAMLADVHLKGAIIVALRAERERAERAEAEVRMADKISKGHVAKIDRLRRDLSREFDRTQKAESALATARNRALEEAAETIRADIAEGREVWQQQSLADEAYLNGKEHCVEVILSLRTKEPTDV